MHRPAQHRTGCRRDLVRCRRGSGGLALARSRGTRGRWEVPHDRTGRNPARLRYRDHPASDRFVAALPRPRGFTTEQRGHPRGAGPRGLGRRVARRNLEASPSREDPYGDRARLGGSSVCPLAESIGLPDFDHAGDKSAAWSSASTMGSATATPRFSRRGRDRGGVQKPRSARPRGDACRGLGGEHGALHRLRERDKLRGTARRRHGGAPVPEARRRGLRRDITRRYTGADTADRRWRPDALGGRVAAPHSRISRNRLGSVPSGNARRESDLQGPSASARAAPGCSADHPGSLRHRS